MSKKKEQLDEIRQQTEKAVYRHAEGLAGKMNIRLFCDAVCGAHFKTDPDPRFFWVEKIEVLALEYPQESKWKKLFNRLYKILVRLKDRLTGQK